MDVKLTKQESTAGGITEMWTLRMHRDAPGAAGALVSMEDGPASGGASARIRASKAESRGDVDRLRSLVVTDGAAPTARQRTQLFSDLLEGRSLCAVVTCALGNPIKRGVATAIGWLNPELRAFDPVKTALAFAHVRCDGAAEQDEIWRALGQLQRRLAPSQTLRSMAQQLGRPSPQGCGPLARDEP